MDCGNIYIKMCEKAVEIQSTHISKAWDYYYGGRKMFSGEWYDGDPTILVTSNYCTDSGYYGLGMKDHEREDYELICWLPRQDQIQDMFKYEKPEYLMNDFSEFIYSEHNIDSDCGIYHFIFNLNAKHFTSMEQLWLSFVMKEKYNKYWNGEDWFIA